MRSTYSFDNGNKFFIGHSEVLFAIVHKVFQILSGYCVQDFLTIESFFIEHKANHTLIGMNRLQALFRSGHSHHLAMMFVAGYKINGSVELFCATECTFDF